MRINKNNIFLCAAARATVNPPNKNANNIKDTLKYQQSFEYLTSQNCK